MQRNGLSPDAARYKANHNLAFGPTELELHGLYEADSSGLYQVTRPSARLRAPPPQV